MSDQVDIYKATQRQLYEHAALNLGLQVDANMQKNTLIAKIKEAQNSDVISVSDGLDDAEAQPASQVKKRVIDTRRSWKDGDYFTIVVAIQNGPGGSRPVTPAVNGKAMSIPRNKPVAVPGAYMEALQNAIATTFVGEGEERVEVNSPRFPFQIVSGPHPKPARAQV